MEDYPTAKESVSFYHLVSKRSRLQEERFWGPDRRFARWAEAPFGGGRTDDNSCGKWAVAGADADEGVCYRCSGVTGGE